MGSKYINTVSKIQALHNIILKNLKKNFIICFISLGLHFLGSIEKLYYLGGEKIFSTFGIFLKNISS